jgi:hypothetical protein
VVPRDRIHSGGGTGVDKQWDMCHHKVHFGMEIPCYWLSVS